MTLKRMITVLGLQKPLTSRRQTLKFQPVFGLEDDEIRILSEYIVLSLVAVFELPIRLSSGRFF